MLVLGAYHVDNGLHVARSHLHQDGHPHLTIDLRTLQHVEQGTFCQVLHVDINRGDNVAAVNRQGHGDVHVFVQNLATSGDAGCTTQQTVVGKLDAVVGRVLGAVHATDST